LEAIAAECSGLDLAPFFDQALRSTDDLPLAELLAEFGVDSRLRVAHGSTDHGGRAEGEAMHADAGLRWSADGERVTYVRSGSAAEDAGLSPGDLPVALDGVRVDGKSWQTQLDALAVGSSVPMHYFRSDELFCTQLAVVAAKADSWVFTLAENCAEDVATRRRAWLGV
ncbi:MAG: M61 family peptidase, partial [Sinobacteraceae bacterium]|nr:M61 family peptidase [Nevskiaceae bacterium]